MAEEKKEFNERIKEMLALYKNGDEKDRAKSGGAIATEYKPEIISIMNKHFMKIYKDEIPEEDFIQAGVHGVLTAVRKYNSDDEIFLEHVSECIYDEMCRITGEEIYREYPDQAEIEKAIGKSLFQQMYPTDEYLIASTGFEQKYFKEIMLSNEHLQALLKETRILLGKSYGKR